MDFDSLIKECEKKMDQKLKNHYLKRIADFHTKISNLVNSDKVNEDIIACLKALKNIYEVVTTKTLTCANMYGNLRCCTEHVSFSYCDTIDDRLKKIEAILNSM